MSNVPSALVLHMADAIIVDVDFALTIFVVIIVVVLVVMDQRLFVVNLNVVHVAGMLLAHVVDVERKFAILVSQVTMRDNAVRLIIAKLC